MDGGSLEKRGTGDMSDLELYRKFYKTWIKCESTRGCYSCCELHDCRCEKDRRISDECTCGRDELEKLVGEIEEIEEIVEDKTNV